MMWPWRTRQPAAARSRGTVPVSVRGFAASDMDRFLSDWRYDGGLTPAELTAHLPTIRARSRQMAKDSPYFKRWLDLLTVNIVGDGFGLKSLPHDGEPGQPSYRLDQSAARFIQWHWWRFCSYRDASTGATWFDVGGRKTEAEMDRMNVRTWARDGEFFIQIVRTNANPYGIAFRVLRPDWCEHNYNVPDTGRGTLIHCGVEESISTRQPVAYWFHTAPTHAQATTPAGIPVLKIPASEIIHGYTQEDEFQPRGVPLGHSFLVTLKMLEMYNKAELVAAIDEACSVRTYYAPPGKEDAIRDLTDPANSDVVQTLQAPKEPGQAEVLPLGYKAEVNTPQHPNREVTAFKTSMLKDVSCGASVEYCTFANDWSGASYSSVRSGTIAERDLFATMQSRMIDMCKTRQFLAWMRAFLASPESGKLPSEKFEKFSEHEFRGRRWTWIDPARDMIAAEKMVAHGWKTNGQVAADLGSDFDDNIAQVSIENQQLTAAGLQSTGAKP